VTEDVARSSRLQMVHHQSAMEQVGTTAVVYTDTVVLDQTTVLVLGVSTTGAELPRLWSLSLVVSEWTAGVARSSLSLMGCRQSVMGQV